ncbi:MAG: NUDIX domain-containing protein, partial [Gammaproteobacteria bacterium]
MEPEGNRIHVAAAVITDAEGRVLVSRRAEDAHQGGLWEFPGGKIEPGENAEVALARELREELDVIPEAARQLIRVPWDYPDRH